MTRYKYQSFPFSDLWGGLNLRDSANQIQDKQVLVCENWNFEGNRIITSKKIKEKYNLWGTTPIRAITKYGDDIYFTHWAKIYKNGVELPITVGTLPDKKWYISVWWDLVFFTFDDGSTTPYYLDGTTLTAKAWVGNPKYNIIYNGKWILGGYGNDNIYYSKTANPSNRLDIVDFSAYAGGSQAVGWDLGGIVTGLKVWENWFYVFKKNSIYYTNSEKDTWSTFSFIFNKITSNGAINQNAIEDVNQEIFYYDGISRSVRRLGYEQNLTTLRDSSISDEIRTVFPTLAEDQTSASLSYKYPNLKVFLRSRFAGTWVNDICLSYNVDVKSWSNETKKTCGVAKGWYLGSIYEWIIYEDDKNPATEWVFVTWEKDLGIGVDYKRFWELEIKGKLEHTLTLLVDIYIDWVIQETRTITVPEVTTPTLGTTLLWVSSIGAPPELSQLVEFRERFDLYYTGRYLKFWVRYEWIWSAEVNYYKIEALPLRWHNIFF